MTESQETLEAADPVPEQQEEIPKEEDTQVQQEDEKRDDEPKEEESKPEEEVKPEGTVPIQGKVLHKIEFSVYMILFDSINHRLRKYLHFGKHCWKFNLANRITGPIRITIFYQLAVIEIKVKNGSHMRD